MQLHADLLQSVSEYRSQRLIVESFAKGFAKAAPHANMTSVLRIPVVVHVVFATAAQNISGAQIDSQIAILNRDFRMTNADVNNTPLPFKSSCADARIEFFLAGIDPEGRPTNGVTRTQTTKTSFHSVAQDIKRNATGGKDPWPTDRYLNIWVAPRIVNSNDEGLLGYATFPGGPADIDGVVVLHSAFGDTGSATTPFDKGRTTTHEIGHWLNLLHIWGDDKNGCAGSDQVADTPNQADHNFGSPSFPHVTCNNGPHGDMFMNYMDYTDDAAMFMFTAGQVDRMRATLAGPRASVVSGSVGGPTFKAFESREIGAAAQRVFDGSEWVDQRTLGPQLKGILSPT